MQWTAFCHLCNNIIRVFSYKHCKSAVKGLKRSCQRFLAKKTSNATSNTNTYNERIVSVKKEDQNRNVIKVLKIVVFNSFLKEKWISLKHCIVLQAAAYWALVVLCLNQAAGNNKRGLFLFLGMVSLTQCTPRKGKYTTLSTIIRLDVKSQILLSRALRLWGHFSFGGL